METYFLTDGRKPTAGHLNYGAAVDLPDPLLPFGPNTLNEQVWPVRVERTNVRTRIGFSHTAPEAKGITDWIGGDLSTLKN